MLLRVKGLNFQLPASSEAKIRSYTNKLKVQKLQVNSNEQLLNAMLPYGMFICTKQWISASLFKADWFLQQIQPSEFCQKGCFRIIKPHSLLQPDFNDQNIFNKSKIPCSKGEKQYPNQRAKNSNKKSVSHWQIIRKNEYILFQDKQYNVHLLWQTWSCL